MSELVLVHVNKMVLVLIFVNELFFPSSQLVDKMLLVVLRG
jgi:hypothetical protein